MARVLAGGWERAARVLPKRNNSRDVSQDVYDGVRPGTSRSRFRTTPAPENA